MSHHSQALSPFPYHMKSRAVTTVIMKYPDMKVMPTVNIHIIDPLFSISDELDADEHS